MIKRISPVINSPGIMDIGGYFELELPQGVEYHDNAIKLNSGRHCLEYILRLRDYSAIWIPYYTCEVVLQPIRKLGLKYQFYRINESLEPIFDFASLGNGAAFLYTNYFGIKDRYIDHLPSQSNIIIDNSQAFFTFPRADFDTFYSPRKFFGVPDGGYLYTYDNQRLDVDYPQATSYDRCTHLLKRIDLGAEAGYTDFKQNDSLVSAQEIMQMSKLTKRMLSSIDYKQVESHRIENFRYYHRELDSLNRLPNAILENVEHGPLVYPLWVGKNGLREKLISEKVYVAQYWPNVLEWCKSDDLESQLALGVIALPIDQRIVNREVLKVSSLLNNYYKRGAT